MVGKFFWLTKYVMQENMKAVTLIVQID